MSRRGLGLAVLSAFAFGSSGPFAKSLIDAGWSPGAAVLVRITGAAAILSAMSLLLWRDRLPRLLDQKRTVLVYGLFAVAGAQVCYFTAVRSLSVGVALLLEYLAPVLVVGWLWLRTRVRPANRTLAGGALAMAGTAGVLDVFGGVRIDLTGVLWALGAAGCLACYFLVLGGRDGDDRPALDPAALTTAGMVVGAIAVGLTAVTGALPVTFGDATTELAGHSTPTWVPLLTLVVMSTVIAYLTGAAGLALLNPTAGSLVGLSEVLFAVLAAWVLLGEWPTLVQLGGAVLVLAGVVLAQSSQRTQEATAPPSVPPTQLIQPLDQFSAN